MTNMTTSINNPFNIQAGQMCWFHELPIPCIAHLMVGDEKYGPETQYMHHPDYAANDDKSMTYFQTTTLENWNHKCWGVKGEYTSFEKAGAVNGGALLRNIPRNCGRYFIKSIG